MRSDESAGLRQRTLSICDLLVEEVLGVDHVGPDLEPHGDVRRSSGSGQPNRVVEECFGRTHLDQHRRKAREVCVDRRDERTLRISAVEIKACEFGEVSSAEQRINRLMP
ncbi:hypothetical protein DHODJN_25855 [Methylorubrum extorquens]